MTDMSPLPRSLDPLPEESLPGYVLRLAHRLGQSPARILQLTGLAGQLQASRGLMMHLDPLVAGSFARATRLTAAEIAGLCMGSMSGRYPQAAPVIITGRPVTSSWVFTTATRYCPRCLAGDNGSPVQQQHGGAWRKTWRLPVVFACPLHRRLLEHLCPSCGQPAMSAPPGGQAYLIPHSTSAGLHPAQCRAVPMPERGARASLCQARLDSPAHAPGAQDPALPGGLLVLQARLLALLQSEGPATVISVGRPATPAQYFADLRLLCSLISGAWPATRDLIPDPGLADAADHYITRLGSVNPRPYRLSDTPPLDPLPGAAFTAAAARILHGDDLRVLGEFVTPARDGAPRKNPRGKWIRRYQRAGHDCSDGFRDALDPLLNTFQRADQRSRGRRAPARKITFAPEHIPEHLQDDWHHKHFRHIGGNTRLLRRAAALRLVQMSAGGSLAEAAAFLGIDHRYLKASPGSAAFTADPAQFRIAVHALARQLSTTPGLINYKHRRDVLRNWRIDPATWQDIISQLPPTKGPFQPELSDCKRQFASEAIWARITQGEHLLAPRIIEDQVSAGDLTWHRRRDNMWHFYLATPPKPHYAELKEILSGYADNLAAAIDRHPQVRPACLACETVPAGIPPARRHPRWWPMADERLPEEAPREEDPEHGDGDLDTSAEAPAALAVTWYLIAVTSADADDRDEDSEPDPRSVVLATGHSAEPPPILLLTPATTGTGSAAQPNVTEQAGKEHRGLPERLREAAISYTADPAATRIVPADGPVGEASDAITGWITGLAEKPARVLAAGAGVPEALATPATGILAICVTSPVTEPVEDASKVIEIAGVIIGLVIQSHMIVTAFGQPLLHSMVSGLIKNALTALWPAAKAREETRPANPASQASSSPDTDRRPPSEFPQDKPTPRSILEATMRDDDTSFAQEPLAEPASTDACPPARGDAASATGDAF